MHRQKDNYLYYESLSDSGTFQFLHNKDYFKMPKSSSNFSLARDKQLAVTVTRSCWALWDTSTGRLLAQLADAPLGAIVTHAIITPTGDNVLTAESGNVVIWDTPEQQVCGFFLKSITFLFYRSLVKLG